MLCCGIWEKCKHHHIWFFCYAMPHFPLRVLRKLGGWDSYNVTEDADLGMRLARHGYRSGGAGDAHL